MYKQSTNFPPSDPEGGEVGPGSCTDATNGSSSSGGASFKGSQNSIVDKNKLNKQNRSKSGAIQSCFTVNRSSASDLKQQVDGKNSCCSKKCIIFITMFLLLFTITFLVAIFATNMLDRNDKVNFSNLKNDQNVYKFFGTKTSYSIAFNQIHKQARSFPAELLYKDDSQKFENQLPDFINNKLDLKTLNDKLMAEGCRISRFYYIGRHAARYPSEKEIKKINDVVKHVQNKLDGIKISKNNIPNYDLNEDNGDGIHSNHSIDNPLLRFQSWESPWVPAQDNMVMQSGYDETDLIARRLKYIFPNLFNDTLTQIKVATTKELRTAQTAVVFMKHLGVEFGSCETEEYPTNATNETEAQAIKSDKCYKDLLGTLAVEKLSFHKSCHEDENTVFSKPFHFKSANMTNSIALEVADKLSLNDRNITNEQLEGLYKACKYEIALKGSSIWCNLFSERDLKWLEFLNDIDDYLNQAAGSQPLIDSTCPVASEMIREFESARSDNSNKPKAFYYFTHAEAIQRILVRTAKETLFMKSSFKGDSLKKHLDGVTIPESRIWKSSLLSPFSANLEYILYQCPNPKEDKNFSLRLVGAVNEKPFKLHMCQDFSCPLEQLIDKGALGPRDCDSVNPCSGIIIYE